MSDIEHISLTEFDSIKHRLGSPGVSDQTKAIREMEVGDAIIVPHEGYVHVPSPEGNRCGILQLVGREGKRNNKRYSIKHLHENTRVAIACITEREESNESSQG